jgi:hypothetical protein
MKGGQVTKRCNVAIHILCAEDARVSLAQPRFVFGPQLFFGSVQFPYSSDRNG